MKGYLIWLRSEIRDTREQLGILQATLMTLVILAAMLLFAGVLILVLTYAPAIAAGGAALVLVAWVIARTL